MTFSYQLVKYDSKKSTLIPDWLSNIYQILLKEKYYLQVIFEVLSEYKITALGNVGLQEDISDSIDDLIIFNKYLIKREESEKKIIKDFLLDLYMSNEQVELDNIRGKIFESLIRAFVPVECIEAEDSKVYNEPLILYDGKLVGDSENVFDVVYDHSAHTEYIECKANVNSFLYRNEEIDVLAGKTSNSKKCKNARKVKYMKKVSCYFHDLNFHPIIYLACLNPPNDEEKSNEYLSSCKYECVQVIGRQRLLDLIFSKC